MLLQSYATNLVSWCKQNPVKYEVVCCENVKPSDKSLDKLRQLNPLLSSLYEDANGILILWEALHQSEISGIFKIHSIEECIELAECERKRINEWSDEEILTIGHDKKWWKSKIPLYRSMVKFYDEGNGDFIAISKIDNCIYFVFHDWMDWVSEEPPIIKLADSLELFISGWSSVQFANPKGLYWMSAVSRGKFTGFNKEGFNSLNESK